MASNRIAIDRTKFISQRILAVIGTGALFREQLAELNSIIGCYNADASFQTDTGVSAGDQTTLTALVANAAAEMSTVTNVAVGLGGQTNVRLLLDKLSTVG
jgi:hypothetical protein